MPGCVLLQALHVAWISGLSTGFSSTPLGNTKQLLWAPDPASGSHWYQQSAAWISLYLCQCGEEHVLLALLSMDRRPVTFNKSSCVLYTVKCQMSWMNENRHGHIAGKAGFFSEAVSAAGLSAGRQRVSCGSERPKNIQIKGCSHESRPGVEPKTL